jgi:hypothetical protein
VMVNFILPRNVRMDGIYWNGVELSSNEME